MAWFKHYDNATTSVKLSQLLDDLGPAGYGRYWLLLELLKSEWKSGSPFIQVHFSEIHRTLRFYKKTMSKQFLNNRSIVHILFKDCYGIPSRLFKDCSTIPKGLSEILLCKKTEIYTFNTEILLDLEDRDSKYNGKKNQISDGLATLEKKREEKTREDNNIVDTIIQLFNTKLQGQGKIRPCVMVSSDSILKFSLLKENHPQFLDIATWEKVFDLVAQSDFLKGENDHGWTLTLGWLFDEKNIEKVLHGQYGADNEVKEIAEGDYEEYLKNQREKRERMGVV